MSRRIRLKAAQRRCYDLAPRRPVFAFISVVLLAFVLLPQIYFFYNDSGNNGDCNGDCCANIGSICSPCEPIDVVYTWVNGSDPVLQETMKKFASLEGVIGKEDLLPSRFDDKQELKYSLRSLEKYAPWVRQVFLVTAGQIPSWLNVHNNWNSKNSRLTVISHDEIIPQELLPTFSSPTIECFLHRIPGLSERFLYFNDDIFLGTPIYLSDFYTQTDGYEIYTAWSVPDCAQGCPWSFLGDSSCDQSCNNEACDYDGGDCLGNPKSKHFSVGNHLDYLGEYADNPFFDEDEKPDYVDKYPGPNENLDPNILQARQVEDGKLLEQLLQNNNQNQDVANGSSRKLKMYISNNTKSINKNSSHLLKSSNKLADIKPKKNISKSLFSKKKNVLREILIKANNSSNINHIVKDFNNRVINDNKFIKKKDTNNDNQAQFDIRKLDIYAKSLIHTNKIFNKVYGFQNRKVPAHVPFLLEKKIIEEMQQKFSEYVEMTKKNKFRRPNDFQFAFAYYHYMLSERKEYTIEEIFEMYDTDKSGTWSDREVRTVLARVRGPPLTAAAVHALETAAKACDSEEHRSHPTPPNERYMDSDMPTLTMKLIVNCPGLRGPLRGALGLQKPHAFARPATTRVTFAMLSSNITKAVTALDEIRRDTKKFICINDNLDSSREEENEIIRMVLQELYDALLPTPSQWELPSHVANKFLRLSDLIAWQRSRAVASHVLMICAILLIILTIHQMNFLKIFMKKIIKV